MCATSLANLLTLLFFLTPVLYPWRPCRSGIFWWVVRLNPFTPFTLAYQQLLFSASSPMPTSGCRWSPFPLLVWALGTALFERLSDTLMEAV